MLCLMSAGSLAGEHWNSLAETLRPGGLRLDALRLAETACGLAQPSGRSSRCWQETSCYRAAQALVCVLPLDFSPVP